MENLINSIKQSLENRNWYAALTLALTLPDIAGKIEYPSQRSSRFRYCEWFENFILDYYTSEIGPKKRRQLFYQEETVTLYVVLTFMKEIQR